MANVANSGKIFESSEAILLVPPEDTSKLAEAIIKLLDDHDLRRDMGDKGRKFIASNYSRQKIAETVEDLIIKIKPR